MGTYIASDKEVVTYFPHLKAANFLAGQKIFSQHRFVSPKLFIRIEAGLYHQIILNVVVGYRGQTTQITCKSCFQEIGV